MSLGTRSGVNFYPAESGEELAGVYADIGEQVGTTTERRE
jgi:hypothetical protein